jgi:hypothetical protein
MKFAFNELVDTITGAFDYLISTGDDSLVGDVTSALEGAAAGIGTGIKAAINTALGLPFEHTIGRIEVQGETVFSGKTIEIPALAEGGIIEESGLAFVDEGERFSGAPGAPGAEVDQSGDMLPSGDLESAILDVKDEVGRVARKTDAVAEAVEDGETTIQFRDEDRYRAVRR